MEFQTLKAVKPTVIRWAFGIFWTSFALDAWYTFLVGPGLVAQYKSDPGLFRFLVVWVPILTLLELSLYALLVWQIGAGKNWARITYLIIWLYLNVHSLLRSHEPFETSVLPVILGYLSTLLQIVGLVLIFGPGRHSFGSQRRLIIQWK